MAINFKYGGKDIILLQYLEERIRRNPGSPFFAMLAYFYLEIDKIPEALSVSQRGVIVHPNYSTGHIVLAMAMERARLFTDAKKELMKALDLHPGSKIAERLIADLEKNEQANEIGKKLADEFRKTSGKDIMKTVAETIQANRSRMDQDELRQSPGIDDFTIPGLDIILDEELSKSRLDGIHSGHPVKPPSMETDLKKAPSEQIPREEKDTGQTPSLKGVQSENKKNSSSIAKAIIDKVVREVSEQMPSEGTTVSSQPEGTTTRDILPPRETKENVSPPLEQAEDSADEASDEFNMDDLARKLSTAGPIKPEEETSSPHDEDSSIELTPEIVTDTLARIFEQQGQIKAAIKAYNILIKKKPEQTEFYNKKIADLTQIQQSKSSKNDAQD